MSDLIDRDKTIEKLKENVVGMGGDDFSEMGVHIDDIESVINSIPSARPKGEWKHLKGDEWLCSNCGYVVWTEGSWEHPLERGKDYCEHCGAQMKERANDEKSLQRV